MRYLCHSAACYLPLSKNIDLKKRAKMQTSRPPLRKGRSIHPSARAHPRIVQHRRLTNAVALSLCSIRLAVPEIAPDDRDLVSNGRLSRAPRYHPQALDSRPLLPLLSAPSPAATLPPRTRRGHEAGGSAALPPGTRTEGSAERGARKQHQHSGDREGGVKSLAQN